MKSGIGNSSKENRDSLNLMYNNNVGSENAGTSPSRKLHLEHQLD